MMAPTTPARRSNAWKVAVLLSLGAGVAGCIALPPLPPLQGIYGKALLFSCLPSSTTAGAEVSPVRGREVCAVEATRGPVCTTTDASGNYSLELPEGTWRVCMAPDGQAEGPLSCDCLELALKDGARTRRDRVLGAGGGSWQGPEGAQVCAPDEPSALDGARASP